MTIKAFQSTNSTKKRLNHSLIPFLVCAMRKLSFTKVVLNMFDSPKPHTMICDVSLYTTTHPGNVQQKRTIGHVMPRTLAKTFLQILESIFVFVHRTLFIQKSFIIPTKRLELRTLELYLYRRAAQPSQPAQPALPTQPAQVENELLMRFLSDLCFPFSFWKVVSVLLVYLKTTQHVLQRSNYRLRDARLFYLSLSGPLLVTSERKRERVKTKLFRLFLNLLDSFFHLQHHQRHLHQAGV